MNEGITAFYQDLKDLYSEVMRTRTKTISTKEFKQKTLRIYATWNADVKYKLRTFDLSEEYIDMLDSCIEYVENEAKNRTANVSRLKHFLGDFNEIFIDHVIPLLGKDLGETTANLMDAASFLGLDTNWSVATCALQLQEVSIKLVAKKANISLDKPNVERLIKAKIKSKDFSFNHQYEAFKREIKRLFKIDMPILTTHLRRMRVKVLHEGYNPQPEEKDSIVSFTIGLLKKLEDICQKI